MSYSLPDVSATLDFIRKNEPRGDRINHAQDGGSVVWDSTGTPTLSIIAPESVVMVIQGIEVIVEILSGETIPVISSTGGKVTIYYPETESQTVPTQKTIEMDVENYGLDAILRECEKHGDRGLKEIDLSGTSGAKYVVGFIDLNNVILDPNLGTSQKTVKIEAGSGVSISAGTGRIIFKVKGWKLLRSKW